MPPSQSLDELKSMAARRLERSLSLLQEGRLDEALEHQREAQALLQQAKTLGYQQQPTTFPERASPPHSPRRVAYGKRGESARHVVVATLTELGVPSPPKLVAEYALARFDVSLDPRSFSSLRRDEKKAWTQRQARPLFIVPALEGTRFQAVRGKVALSAWTLERRIVGPWSERVDHLTAAAQMARQLRWLEGLDPSAAARLARLVARVSATVRGAIDPSERVEPAQVERAVRAELSVLQPDDQAWRAAAAEKARTVLSEEQRIWGAPPPRLLKSVGEAAPPREGA